MKKILTIAGNSLYAFIVALGCMMVGESVSDNVKEVFNRNK